MTGDADVRTLHTAQEMTAAAQVLQQIWSPGGGGEAPMEPGLLVALEHAGNYVCGAFDGEQLIGATVGFFGAPDPVTGRCHMMHSHIAGVLPEAAGRGIGAAMKLHQRQWCLQRGVIVMEWTFDPLVARNARFNLHRLGARLEEYLPQFYGEMRDATNAGQGSDRALVRWHLEAPSRAAEPSPEVTLLTSDDDGAPLAPVRGDAILGAAGDHTIIGLRIPADIKTLRDQRPEVSAQWRIALRETLHPLVSVGWSVAGISTTGEYLLRRPDL